MSTISGVSGGSTGWDNVSSSTGSSRKERMFAKADTNGDGSVDGAELQSMLDKMAQKSGGTAANADDVLKTMDSDGNGTLDASELDAGMKSLMPAPSSTMDFAQQRGEDRVHGGGGPPPDGQDASDSTTATGTDASDGLGSLLDNLFQAADTDGSGSLDKTELDNLKTNFDTAIQSLESGSGTDGVASTSGSTASASDSSSDGTDAGSGSGTSTGSSDQMMATLTALANLVLKEYASTAAASAATQTAGGASLSVTA